MASFLGFFLAVTGVMTLLSSAFLTGPVISRCGVRVSLLILPVALQRAALEETLAHSRARIFLLLSFLYVRRTVLQAHDNIARPLAEKRAYALEVLDVLVSPDLKKLVFPLLADSAPGQKLQQLQASPPSLSGIARSAWGRSEPRRQAGSTPGPGPAHCMPPAGCQPPLCGTPSRLPCRRRTPWSARRRIVPCASSTGSKGTLRRRLC